MILGVFELIHRLTTPELVMPGVFTPDVLLIFVLLKQPARGSLDLRINGKAESNLTEPVCPSSSARPSSGELIGGLRVFIC